MPVRERPFNLKGGYDYRISTQSILLIDSLYRNATTKIKWKDQLSEEFKIEQGDRQGGTLSADLYKIYINQLLDLMQELNHSPA
jgi:hypothetical protein